MDAKTLLTMHFSLGELTTTSQAKFKNANFNYGVQNYDKLLKLAEFAEKVRAALGVPMIVTSGVRCPDLNKTIGGASGSQHVLCEAIDFVPSGVSVARAFDLIRASALKFGQLIKEHSGGKEWVHVSLGAKNEVLVYNGASYTKIKR